MTTETRRTAADTALFTRAWQDGVEAMFSGYGEQWRRLVELGGGAYGPRWFDGEQVRETLNRFAEGTREVTNAQIAVAGEWLRTPLWLTGAASPADLQARYFRLFEAYRELARVYIDSALGFQRALTGATERATETAREIVDSQVQTARRVANDARQAQDATVDAARTTAETARATTERVVEQTRETTARVVEQAREVAEEAAERADLAQRPIKANVNARGEKIYHLPGQASYERTQAEETFATEAEAQAAGFRRAQSLGGGRIKGKISRDGEKIYHLPGQANYDRIEEADALFETEEDAQAAGFRAAQR